jgi:hypothetical protein
MNRFMTSPNIRALFKLEEVNVEQIKRRQCLLGSGYNSACIRSLRMKVVCQGQKGIRTLRVFSKFFHLRGKLQSW